jgi:tRNA-dihydrouridine synthase
MIGRAIQGYPWIFREARQYLETGIVPAHPSLAERQTIMLRHVRDMVSVLGEEHGVREMRKHLCWYTKGLPEGAEFRERVNHLARLEDVKREIGNYFASMQYDAEAVHPASMPA